MNHYAVLNSPVGDITLATNGSAITELHIAGDRYFTAVPSEWEQAENHPVLSQARIELTEYFNGKRSAFTVPLSSAGTPFQQKVWQALQAIPSGATTTYSQIAQAIDRPNASRAVGTAIGRNPICIIVPCHRVLASGGGVGGYVAGLNRKQFLLELETHVA